LRREKVEKDNWSWFVSYVDVLLFWEKKLNSRSALIMGRMEYKLSVNHDHNLLTREMAATK
jgi:hypothetical protein